MTVEADLVGVESRLTAGHVGCPDCPGVLRLWGVGLAARGARYRRGVPAAARSLLVCLVTHVLPPVTVLLRRAYAVDVIGAALLARAAGHGHRWIGAALTVPASTVRGWVPVMVGRLDAARVQLLQGARRLSAAGTPV